MCTRTIMRRAISQQMSFGDGFIDASLYELDDELKQVDELLADPQLLKPFEAVFDPSLGRPGTAVGVYLRMMYLKFRWGLSYQELEREVKERLPWRYFCRLSLIDAVPDASELFSAGVRPPRPILKNAKRKEEKSSSMWPSLSPKLWSRAAKPCRQWEVGHRSTWASSSGGFLSKLTWRRLL
jgi:hypothetical protein